ncbi:MAG TPA: DUF4126 domain-containing protein [Bacteroidia bacterium]|nr:DUF4126 domain-containing protein [Bacteroidia bacterium]
MEWKQIVLSLLMGLGLSACCGLRVFVPLLLAGIAHRMGWLSVNDQFMWLSNYTSIAGFGIASVVEILAYKIPFIDHLLDTITTPASIVAGTILSASTLFNIDPMMQWTLALLVGGGSAGLLQTATTLLRGTSTATTGGTANPFFAMVESTIAIVASIISIILPLIAGIIFLVVCFFVFRRIRRKR